MKILITTGIFSPDIGGPATYSSLLLGELPKEGFEVSVLTYGSGRRDGVFYVSKRWPRGLRHLICLSKVLKLGKRSDVILAADSSFGAAFISALASRILKKRFIVRVTGDYAWEQGQQRFGVKELIDDFQNNKYSWRVEMLRKFQNFTVKNADIVIAPSRYLKRMILGWGVKEANTKVIYNAVDVPGTIVSKEDARHNLGLRGKILVSVGRLVPWKGFGSLVEIAAELRKDFPDLKLIIIGSGPEENNLKAKSSKLKANALFTGALPKKELAQYLKAADVFVLNTAYEGFSHQIIEAMGLGLPVITTDVGGNPEVIENNKSGILIKYNEKAQLIEAIRKVINNKALRMELSQNAITRAGEFSKKRMIDNLKNLL